MDPATRRAIGTAMRLALAHHPLCGWFQADVFGRRVGVCSGCAVTWPLFFAGVPLVLLAAVRGADPWAFVAAGLVLGLPQGTTLLWRGGRLWRAAVKAVGGAGLAMVLVGGILLPVAWAWKVWGFVALSVAILAFLALRMRSILRTCDACPWQRDWERCPGFGLGDV